MLNVPLILCLAHFCICSAAGNVSGGLIGRIVDNVKGWMGGYATPVTIDRGALRCAIIASVGSVRLENYVEIDSASGTKFKRFKNPHELRDIVKHEAIEKARKDGAHQLTAKEMNAHYVLDRARHRAEDESGMPADDLGEHFWPLVWTIGNSTGAQADAREHVEQRDEFKKCANFNALSLRHYIPNRKLEQALKLAFSGVLEAPLDGDWRESVRVMTKEFKSKGQFQNLVKYSDDGDVLEQVYGRSRTETRVLFANAFTEFINVVQAECKLPMKGDVKTALRGKDYVKEKNIEKCAEFVFTGRWEGNGDAHNSKNCKM